MQRQGGKYRDSTVIRLRITFSRWYVEFESEDAATESLVESWLEEKP